MNVKYMQLELRPEDLEKRFQSIVNDDVHELAPGLVEVSLESMQRRMAEKKKLKANEKPLGEVWDTI